MVQWKKVEDAFPTPLKVTEKVVPQLADTFRDLTAYEICGILCLPDQSSFIEVEVSSVKLWNIEYHKEKPFTFFDDFENEITSAGLDPSKSNVFVFSDSSGEVQLFDMSSNQIVSSFSTSKFGDPQFADLSVTSLTFKPTGDLFVARSFTHLQVWDLRNNIKPLASQEVHHFPERGNYLHSDSNHDIFGSLFLPSDEIYSGSFGQVFVSWDWKKSILIKHKASRRATISDSAVDFTKKVSKITVSHNGSILGVASTSSLFFYQL